MTNKNRNKDTKDRQSTRAGQPDKGNKAGSRTDEQTRGTDLRDSPMMARLMDAMERGEDVGHYGRLVFAMVARFFLSDDQILDLFSKQPDFEQKEARVMLAQVHERDYNPPKRERILEWQETQDFKICPDTEDPNGCNVYRDLTFPEEIYENIEDFWEEKIESDQRREE